MKKLFLLFSAFSTIYFLKATEITDTVSMGANYANQVWYSLPNNEAGNASINDWDIAFQIQGISSSIIANGAKSNLKIYQSPFSVADWALVDTVDIGAWSELYNSDTSWDLGALNTYPDDNTDLGWGVYNMNTHTIAGDSVYVIQLSNGTWKKFKIDQLSSGKYYFSWANLDGTNAQSDSIKKSDYSGKNFAYFSIENKQELNREPISADWDLTFTKYTTIIYAPQATPYGVTGVLQNTGTNVVKAYPVDVNTQTHNGYSFETPINIIGYDWKKYDMNSSSYLIADSTIYFIQRKNGDIWKVIFTGFGGAANGNFIFTKELVYTQTTGISETEKINSVNVYPNPSNGQLNLIYTSNRVENSTLRIFNLTGKVVYKKELVSQSGINQESILMSDLQKGIYFLSLNNSKAIKLIVE
ncbi:MAG TPA: T9SS type A sorting domain-containing protein [Chitinophagales bacterium]|nr:T9SS type A sorting domain-containing protein [Chitinophagales bacterium]HRP40221.1 T9SS type A sorting domain-containing protein [Chitinophagales bacterium]